MTEAIAFMAGFGGGLDALTVTLFFRIGKNGTL